MKCPCCEAEMKNGYFYDAVQPIQWIPEGKKPSAFRGGTAKEAVCMGTGSMWKGYRANAAYCQKCGMVILRTK